MNERFTKSISDRYELLLKLENTIEQRLKDFPDGRIKVKHTGNKPYYYLTGGNIGSDEKLISKEETDLIKKLSQKGYFKKVLVRSKEEKKYLKRFLDNYPAVVAEEVYDKLPEDRKRYVKPLISADDEYVREWLEKPYTPKPFKKEDPFFVTLRGERVRSKSEVIIADRLLANGVPYKYECPILVGNEIIHPDFSILRIRDRKILYLEHNGKVGDQQYADDMVDRINKYEAAGIHQGDRLFLTYETANRPLDVRVLDIMINDLFK